MIEGADDKPPGCLLVNMAVEVAPWDHEVGFKTLESFDTVEKLLAELIQGGQERGEFATQCLVCVYSPEPQLTK